MAITTAKGRAAKTKRSGRRVGIYLRISKDRANEVSIALQERACRDYCAQKGWQIVGVYVDRGRSAFKADQCRPELDRLLADLGAGAVDTLVCYRLDRLTRSITHFHSSIVSRLDGAEFVSISEGFDTTTAMGKAMFQVALVFAELESGIKSERIQDWHEHRAVNGKRPTGPRAFGYTPARDLFEPEAKLVRAAARDVVAGTPVAQIVDRWNDAGVTTPRGSQWSRPSLTRVLTNPHTAGYREIDGELVKGTWPGILARPTFEKVVGIFDGRRDPAHSNRRRHLLGGIVRCDVCSTPMAVRSHNAGPRYTCWPRKGFENACKGVSIKLDDLDQAVRDAVVDAATTGRLATALETVDPRQLVDELETELEALGRDYGAGRIGRAEWLGIRAGIEERLEAARRIAATASPAELRVDPRRFDALDLEARRLVVRWALDDLRIRPATVLGRFDPARIVWDWRV